MMMVQKVFLRTAYNYDMLEASNETAIECKDASLATQADRDEVDINTIVNRFLNTGKLPDDIRVPQYGDFTGIRDYQTALNALNAANANFMSLPAELRSRFDNDPAQFIAFCENEANLPELIKMGLVVDSTPPVSEPMPVRVVNPAAPDSA